MANEKAGAQRLDRLLASTGSWSRRDVRQLVRQGRVLVDGVPAASPEEKYDPETAEIRVDGQRVVYRRVTWLMMNKPAGVVSATEDSREKTVLDLLEPALRKKKLFPVGRLDKDAEGLLLLTDDGDLAHRLLSPKYHVDKVYYVRTQGQLTEEDGRAFAQGVTLGDGFVCLPAELKILRADAQSEALVTVREGKYHQVKRMLASRGKPVLYLRRLQMGNLTLDPTLEKGTYRFLTEAEQAELQKRPDLT